MQRLQDLFGIELPLIQAPMAGVQDSALTVAVSNAGGLGSLPCAMLSLEQLEKELTLIQQQTKQPYNVNFFCHTPPKPNPKREQAWRQSLKPFYDEFGLDIHNIPEGAGRAPFSHEAADILEKFKPKVVSFHFGLPTPELLERVKSWGSKVISSATTLDEARWLEQHGADAIIAQGLEAGGHRGHFLSHDLSLQTDLAELLTTLTQHINIPIIAAGGIATSQDVQTALNLGAAGVQVGTAYLCTQEAKTSAIHRQALQQSQSGDTTLTTVFSGRPARSLRNRVINELGALDNQAPEFPLASTALAPLRSSAEKQNSGDFSPLWSGQKGYLCESISAAELTHKLMQC